MNCKRHPSEDSPGVCARCLRDRLLDLLAAQHDQPSSPSRHRKAVPSAPPRPVSSGDSRHHRRSFFGTPQVGPDAGCTSKASGGFSLLSFIFGHRRSGEEGSGSGSGSRLRSIIGGRHRRKKYKTPPETEEVRRRASAPCKGLSPAEEESDYETDSGYSTESPGAWRMRTPSPIRRGAVAAHRNNNNNKSAVSVFAVCLSPLVRATPSRRRSQTPEVGFSGDLRAGMKPQQHQKDHHRSAAGGGCATLAPNRSKKLVDLGRFR